MNINADCLNGLKKFEPYSAENLKAILKDRGLTIERASRESGIAFSSMLKWTSGHSRPNYDNMLALGRFFQVYFYIDHSQ
jgi:transcriptional regulator with XRE-family HTH domain